MTQTCFDRLDLQKLGSQVKVDVLHALIEAHGVPMLPENYSQFVLTAMTCYGSVVRAELLEIVSQTLAAGKLDENGLDKAISHLCRDLDREAMTLGRQVELIAELQQAPPGRH